MTQDNRPAPYSLRFEADMRKKLEASAQKAGRSLHAEIIMRLDNSLRSDASSSGGELDDRIRLIAIEVVREELSRQAKP